MLHSEKTGLKGRRRPSPQRIAADARRTIAALARPSGDFDARRYFRGAADLGFYNIKMPVTSKATTSNAANVRFIVRPP